MVTSLLAFEVVSKRFLLLVIVAVRDCLAIVFIWKILSSSAVQGAMFAVALTAAVCIVTLS